MTTRNTWRPASALEQRIVGRQLARFLLEHHRHRVADRIGEPVHAAHEHLRLALELERSLAHRAGEYLEQARIHRSGLRPYRLPPAFASTRLSNSLPSRSANCAATGTYHSRGSANAAHLTESFSVMSTGAESAKSSSRAAKRWWSGKACSTTSMPSARSSRKKRAGLPIPATACTRLPPNSRSGRGVPCPSSRSAP